MDKYLYENELTLFQLVWGERDYYPFDGNWDLEPIRSIRNKETFSQAYEYVPKSKKR